jgi:hypothetical protein
MNIDPDYFIAIIEDPSPLRLDEIRAELRVLIG